MSVCFFIAMIGSSNRVSNDCTLTVFNSTNKISLRSKTDSSVSLTLKYSQIINATCHPVRERFALCAAAFLNEDFALEVSVDDLLGILSIVIVVFIMEKETRFFWWLFMFHLHLIEECDVEVLVAPSFRCDARVFPPLRRHAEPMRRFVVLRRRSSSALSRHTDSAKNCMACCWIEMCCEVLYHSLHGALQPWWCLSWSRPSRSCR